MRNREINTRRLSMIFIALSIILFIVGIQIWANGNGNELAVFMLLGSSGWLTAAMLVRRLDNKF